MDLPYLMALHRPVRAEFSFSYNSHDKGSRYCGFLFADNVKRKPCYRLPSDGGLN